MKKNRRRAKGIIMSVKVGINGFGRIGRTVFRAICDTGALGKGIDVAAVADLSADADYLSYQIRYDSIHGRFGHQVSTEKSNPSIKDADILVVGDHRTRCIPASADPSLLPWKTLGVDIVIESSGIFTDSQMASGHLAAGAKKVIITGPAQGHVKTIVMGVNEGGYIPREHHIISCASCTMNALGMLVEVLLREGIGIETGMMTAVNSYTASQRLVDGISRKDRRSGRAAGVNIIPTSTSVTTIAHMVFPALKGKLGGISYRVPTADVSAVDLTFRAGRDTSIAEIDALLKKASGTYLKGLLGYTEEELVSSDFINDTHSAVYDSAATMRGNLRDERRLFRIISWHDNEWGYANRVVDLIGYLKL
jgi:glyceraldehyde 3-phosphate dehydrogenase